MKLLNKIYLKFLNKLRYDLEKNPKTSNVIKITKESFIHKSVKLQNARISGNITIGKGTKIAGGVIINANSKVDIGNYTSINGPNTDIYAKINDVKIGSFCSIARNVQFQEFDHKFSNFTTYHFHRNILKTDIRDDIESKGNIEIGNDVWIGTQCVILSGAKVSHGAVIAANSVVTGEIPPYAIVAGSPAKVIKYRFNENQIKHLLRINWWDQDLSNLMNSYNSILNEKV
ncbi:MAG: antibiotic acetyltransferase [Bacteroidetes bacterium]|nr:MAG: antibiotic acetyltransferase [Bacteroidota bacterium]